MSVSSSVSYRESTLNLTGFDMVNIHTKSYLNYRKKSLNLLKCSHRSHKREMPFFLRGLKLSLQNVTKALYQDFLCPTVKFFFLLKVRFLIYKNELMMLQMIYVMYSFYFMCRWLLDKSEQYNTLGGNALSF